MTEHPLTLTFHGAAQTVTGSCMEFAHGGQSLLVDCGMFQGSRTLETLNNGAFAFDPSRIPAVVLTHAHIDHSGLLPKLVAQGFDGVIWCTGQTADLLEYMLADAGRIQEADTQRRNRRRDRAGEKAFAPAYTEADALAAWRLCRKVGLEEWFEPAGGIRARLWNAGHILGAASVELVAGGVKLMCSGDLGPENKAFLSDPEGPSGFDHLVCESTYGGREREDVTIEQRRKLLGTEVRAALARGGNLIIPVFALERTQELMLDLAFLLREGEVPDVPVFIDSPLASKVTGVFSRYSAELEDTGGWDIFAHSSFHFTGDVSESIRLNSVSGAIIMAASGMCEGGRIRHHLMHNLHRPDSTVLFVGFQARGSLGRVILEGAKTVRISGTDVRVRAQIRRIDHYSAHADQGGLVDWIGARMPVSGTVFLDHGEPEGTEALRRELQRKVPDAHVRIPAIGETYGLAAGAKAKRLATGRTDIQQAIGADWQNDYAAFATALKKRLTNIRSEEKRRDALRRMSEILDSYNEAVRPGSNGPKPG
ncbi:MBL fold metallo-hydrolase RNA specificity domain-containing protein [Croceicoccus bisphenolivorans]|uniref:MBL fold metallo-hydrolase RNA specificity domain-containing protein n=1 Tax=Croceicoccus bisphenolivorans TaxID=1783232 RepID=UPI000831B21C|nr:MBL fold metallo-hydrolase [Croceicoccus bisphenolivorans]